MAQPPAPSPRTSYKARPLVFLAVPCFTPCVSRVYWWGGGGSAQRMRVAAPTAPRPSCIAADLGLAQEEQETLGDELHNSSQPPAGSPQPQPPAPAPKCVFLEAGLGAACMGNSTSAPLGLVPGLVTSYARKCFTERIDNWKLSLWNSTRYTGTVSHLRLGARYYLGRSSVSRAYRLASNHIRPLHRHQRSDTSSVSEVP